MSVSTRRPWGALAAVLAVVAAVACTAPPPAGCASGTRPATVPASSPWADVLCRQTSQKPPPSLNGVVYRDGLLWMASLVGGELVVADAASGEMVGRFGPDQGIGTGPDDLAMTADGTVYWSGWTTGEVGKLAPGARSRALANVGGGVNPVVLGADGGVYVSRLFTGMGLYRIDPATGAVRVLSPGVAVNAFGFGPDGAIYGPTGLTLPSRLVRVDPSTGRSTRVTSVPGLLGSSVRFPPAVRGEAPTTAYVLTSTAPVSVLRIDVTTGRKVAPDIRLPLTLADNIAFAPDGRMFVTGFTEPAVAVVETDGRARKVAIGRM